MWFNPTDTKVSIDLPQIPEGFIGRVILFLGGDILRCSNLSLELNKEDEEHIIRSLCSDFGIEYHPSYLIHSAYKKFNDPMKGDLVYHFEYYILYTVETNG